METISQVLFCGQQPAYTGYYSFIITVYPVVVANRRSL